MTTEQKQLVEAAARLLGYKFDKTYTHELGLLVATNTVASNAFWFNPYDPERGDLMRVWLALPECTMGNGYLDAYSLGGWEFSNNDYQSLATAVLRAASAVLKARGGRVMTEELYHQQQESIARLEYALENCRLYAARHRKEEWAQHILRFCWDGGARGQQCERRRVMKPDVYSAFEIGAMPILGNEHRQFVDLSEYQQLRAELAKEREKVAQLEKQLETERMRLAACSTAALGYFDGCHDEYKSASLDDVLRLREQLAAAQKDAERYRWLRVQDNDDLRFAVLDEAHWRGAGDCDPYFFDTPEELDAAIDNEMKGEK